MSKVLTKNEETSIRQVLEQLVMAWNAGDAHSYAQCFTDECDYVTFAGEHLKGRKENEQTHHDLFHSWALRESTMHTDTLAPSITFLSETIALLHATGAIKLRFQSKPPLNRLSIQTIILVKTNGLWKIRAFHNCRIQKPGLLQRMIMAFQSN